MAVQAERWTEDVKGKREEKEEKKEKEEEERKEGRSVSRHKRSRNSYNSGSRESEDDKLSETHAVPYAPHTKHWRTTMQEAVVVTIGAVRIHQMRTSCYGMQRTRISAGKQRPRPSVMITSDGVAFGSSSLALREALISIENGATFFVSSRR